MSIVFLGKANAAVEEIVQALQAGSVGIKADDLKYQLEKERIRWCEGGDNETGRFIRIWFHPRPAMDFHLSRFNQELLLSEVEQISVDGTGSVFVKIRVQCDGIFFSNCITLKRVMEKILVPNTRVVRLPRLKWDEEELAWQGIDPYPYTRGAFVSLEDWFSYRQKMFDQIDATIAEELEKKNT